MNVLVTGGAGFIGSHIVDKLIEMNHSVTIIDSLISGKKENINPAAEFIQIDIRDDKLAEIFSKKEFNTVYHLAAQMDVRKSVEDPVYDADVNILGSINLLENSVKNNVNKIIFISSGGVMYGECGDNKPAEDLYPNPLCPYGDSKLALEFYLNFYREIHGIKTTVFRLGNVYGPRQDPHGEAGVVAIFCGAMLKNTDVKIFGDGKQLRDYVYVGDIANINMLALENGSGIYNVGTGNSSSVNEIFSILKEITGYAKDAVYKPPREGELRISRLDVGKVGKEFNWKTEVDFKEGLRRTVEYFNTRN